MKLLSLAARLVLLVFCFVNTSIAKEWRGITPLHSTRLDVERILGVKSSQKTLEAFDLGTERVVFVYAERPCEHKHEKWNVPVGTVLEIAILPKSSIALSGLDIDISAFKKSFSKSKDVVATVYKDETKGFSFEVVNGKVIGFGYHPTEKDRHLLCPAK